VFTAFVELVLMPSMGTDQYVCKCVQALFKLRLTMNLIYFTCDFTATQVTGPVVLVAS
jgi:hypothetical protein